MFVMYYVLYKTKIQALKADAKISGNNQNRGFASSAHACRCFLSMTLCCDASIIAEGNDFSNIFLIFKYLQGYLIKIFENYRLNNV